MANKNENPAPSKNKIDPTVLVALITLVGTIALVLSGFPPFQRLFEPEPTATIQPTLKITPIDTAQPTFTGTHTLVLTEIFTPVPFTETVTLTPNTALPFGMQVRLTANQTHGRIPLKVRLNTKGSFFRDAAGAEFPCGACNYSWQVRSGSNIVFGPQMGQADFEYTFRDKGTYFITVLICRSRSDDCGSSGALIVAE